jgi:hypothetical protein
LNSPLLNAASIINGVKFKIKMNDRRREEAALFLLSLYQVYRLLTADSVVFKNPRIAISQMPGIPAGDGHNEPFISQSIELVNSCSIPFGRYLNRRSNLSSS